MTLRHWHPLAWFLPGRKRMRGGAARHFASDWLFHRGIQAEATWSALLEKVNRYQRLAESRSWRAGFFCGSQGIHFTEATEPESTVRKPGQSGAWRPLLRPHVAAAAAR